MRDHGPRGISATITIRRASRVLTVQVEEISRMKEKQRISSAAVQSQLQISIDKTLY